MFTGVGIFIRKILRNKRKHAFIKKKVRFKKVNKKEITLSIKKATKKNDQEKNRKEMENANKN